MKNVKSAWMWRSEVAYNPRPYSPLYGQVIAMRYCFAIAAVLLATASGCNSSITWPDWCHPGWIDQQRNRAEQYDPYPEVDFGQSMYGTRPRDFQDPAPEPQKVQNQRSYFRRFGQLAPASRY